MEDCRQISVSIILTTHDLSQPIRIVVLGEIHREKEMRDIVKGSYSIGAVTLKTNIIRMDSFLMSRTLREFSPFFI